MKAKVNLSNIIAYIVGNFRDKLFFSRCSFLIRPHIKEQIRMRLHSMQDVCYDEGSCQLCGCETPALQMANKACDKPCYPFMLVKTDWQAFKKFKKWAELDKDLNIIRTWKIENEEFVNLKK